MTTTMRTPSTSQTPWGGLMVAAIGLIAMAVTAVVFWPDLSPTLVTREAAGNHGQNVAARGPTVLAMPLTLLLLAGVFTVGPRIDEKYLGRLRLNAGRNLHNAAGCCPTCWPD